MPGRTPSNEATWSGDQAAPREGGPLQDLADAEARFTAQYRANPQFRPPKGYHIEADGTVKHDQHAFLLEHPWLIPLMGIGVGVAAAAIGGGGAGAGAGSALGPTTGASMDATAAAAAGSTVPPSLAVGGAGVAAGGAAGGLSWSSILSRYLIPGAASAVDAILGQRTADANRAQDLQIAQQAVGYNQSLQDPFRATMHQANDVGRLERMATPPPAYSAAAGGPYSNYMNAPKTPTLSSDYLNTVRGAQSRIARGQGAMPNMVDPHNWGQTGTSDLSGAPPSSNAGPLGASGNPPPFVPPSVARAPVVDRTMGAADDPNAQNPYTGLSLASLLARYGGPRGMRGGVNA